MEASPRILFSMNGPGDHACMMHEACSSGVEEHHRNFTVTSREGRIYLNFSVKYCYSVISTAIKMYCKIKIMSNFRFQIPIRRVEDKYEVSLEVNVYTFFRFSSTSLLQSHLLSDSFKSYPLMKRALMLKNSGGTR